MLRLTKTAAAFGLIALGIQVFVPSARGQAIAYTPVIGLAPTGSTLTVTPVVSADRRYVRLSVQPFFNAVNGFSTFGVPGAVSGGPSGNFNAGMNGVIGPVGFNDGSGINPYGLVGNVGEMRAGPLPMNGGLGAGTSVAQSDFGVEGPAAMMNGWPVGEFDEAQAWPLGVSNRLPSGGQRGKSSAKAVSSKQRRAARKAAAEPKTTTSPSVRRAR